MYQLLYHSVQVTILVEKSEIDGQDDSQVQA